MCLVFLVSGRMKTGKGRETLEEWLDEWPAGVKGRLTPFPVLLFEMGRLELV